MTGAQGSQQQPPSVSNRGLHTRFSALCMAREPVPVPGPGFPHTDKVRGRLSNKERPGCLCGSGRLLKVTGAHQLSQRDRCVSVLSSTHAGTQQALWRVFNSLSFITRTIGPGQGL